MNRTVSRVVSCVSLGAALMILCMVARYVLAQSPSVFRALVYLHPLALIPWLPVGLGAGVAAWIVSRRHREALALSSLAALAVALVVWYAVQLPSVSAWLLPAATLK